MTIELNHTIVQTRDKAQSVRFYERMFGFQYEGEFGPFAPVKIPNQSLTLDFLDDRESFDTQHFAFKVSEAEFDEIFNKIVEDGLDYGSEPWTSTDKKINHWNGGRGVYFRDPSGHLLEILTRDYSAEMFQEMTLGPEVSDWRNPGS